MKILIVGQWFISEENGQIIVPGGTERYVYGLANQLQNDGYDVMILTSTSNNSENHRINGFNVSAFKVPGHFYGHSVDTLSFINTLKFASKFNPDIIHVVSTRYRFAAGAVAAAKLLKVKTVYSITNLPHKNNRKWLPIFLDDYFFTKIIKHVDVVIALSREMKDILELEICPKEIKIIPSFFAKSYHKEVKKNGNHLLFVGRLDALKGLESLIESLSLVKKEIPEIRLSLAGSGDLVQHLKELILKHGLEENIILEGHLDDELLSNMYSKSNIFIFPSFSEGMPMALLEAMSAGLPIIAFDIKPCVEALDDGKYGCLIKKGDVNSMAKKTIELLKNEEIMTYYSKKSMERSINYSQKTVVRKIEEAYYELVGG